MPIRISALTADRGTVTVPFVDDTLKITYKPSAINVEQEERELADRAEGRHLLAMAKSLAELVESWDLLDDEGKPVPVSVEVLSPLGLTVLQKITRAILDDVLPNRTPPAVSRNGSTPTASSEPVRTGT